MLQKNCADNLSEKLMQLHVNLLCWSRVYFEDTFSVNGKGEEEKLTLQQYSLMAFMKDMQVHTVSALSEVLNLSKSSISLNISKLVFKGYLRKQLPASGDDGRKAYFYLTEKGTEVMKRTEWVMTETVSKFFQSFDEETQKEISGHLEALNQILQSGGNNQ